MAKKEIYIVPANRKRNRSTGDEHLIPMRLEKRNTKLFLVMG